MKVYSRHEVACIISEVLGDDCACNFNNNDEWLPDYCDFADTCIISDTEDLIGIAAVDTGDVLKYMCRWVNKNGLQDLEKAQWYLNHLINHVKAGEQE